MAVLRPLKVVITNYPEAQVEELKFIRCGRLEFGLFDVDAAHPIALGFQALYQMVADEASGSCD